MTKLISIKEARLKKNISIKELANALNLNINVIRALEEDLELPDKWKLYKVNYERSIYKYLGYTLPNSNNFQNIPNDYSKIILTSFFFIFSFIILFFSSLNVYLKYNQNLEIDIFEKDEIYVEVDKFVSQKNFENIDHHKFLDSLSVIKRINYSQKLELYVNDSSPIYYKLKNINQKTIEFGELLQQSKIEFDLNNDFLIDLSNIANIEKIIYRGIEIKPKNNYDFYLKDFNINKLEEIL